MDIEQWAKLNNMTPEEFECEMYEIIAAIGTMQIDKADDDIDMVIFNCSDSISDIQVSVRRINDKNV